MLIMEAAGCGCVRDSEEDARVMGCGGVGWGCLMSSFRTFGSLPVFHVYHRALW
jgi:hypothetical protein